MRRNQPMDGSMPMETNKGDERKERREAAKEAILEAAMKLFLEKGYGSTSTTQICAAAGINKATLFYYFGSKRDLLYEPYGKDLHKILKPRMEKASSIADPSERFAFLLEDYARAVCMDPSYRILLHEAIAVKDTYFEPVRREWKKQYLLLKDTISELQSIGKIAPDLKASWVALLLLGMISWITFWFDYSRKEQIDEIVETVLRIAQSIK